jgi:hypothetical protein
MQNELSGVGAGKDEELKKGEVAMAKATSTKSAASEEVKEEEKKGEDLSAIKSLNMDQLMQAVDQTAKQGPWRQDLANKDSILYKTLIGDVENLFTKKFTLFFDLAQKFGISNDPAHPVTNPLDLPLIAGDVEILLAIYVQNQLHPKNAQRRDAVTNGTYVSINNNEQAGNFLAVKLQENMRNRA